MTKRISLLLIALGVSACAEKMVDAPMPEKKPIELEIHGDVRVDDYFWLKERENPEVIAYLEAENAYTKQKRARMRGMGKIRFDEIK